MHGFALEVRSPEGDARLLSRRLPVTHDDVPAILAAFGRSAVLYHPILSGRRSFFASTAILKLTADATGGLEVELASIELFDTPIEVDGEPQHASRTISSLPIETVNDLIARGTDGLSRTDEETPLSGLGEIGAAFSIEVSASDILDAYGYCCAFTGQSLRAEAAIDPDGALLQLGPAADPLEPGLAIPACADAIRAYERGHLSLFADGGFILAPAHADPEFLERLNPLGRLATPANPVFVPNRRALARHRRDFMLERFDRR